MPFSLPEVAEYLYAIAFAHFLTFPRMLGLISVFPLFTWTQIPRMLRAPIALTLTIPLAYSLYTPMREIEIANPVMILIIIKEYLLGTLIGFVLALPVWGAQAAGDVLDMYRGASMPNISDPSNAAQISTSGGFFLYMTLALIVVTGGIPQIIGLIYDSFQIWPIAQLLPEFKTQSFNGLMGGMIQLFRLAILLSGPMMIAFAIADLFLVFAGKGYRQLQIFELSITLKNLIYAIFFPIYISYFWDYIEVEIQDMFIYIVDFIKNL